MTADLITQWATKNAPAMDKAVPDLTPEEQLALYILAGGEVVTAHDGTTHDGTTLRSRRQFGIFKTTDRFRVIIDNDSPPRGQSIQFKHRNSPAA